jgi:hypothetical protein
MPEIDFDPQFKKSGTDVLEFDRLKLKKDERARIVFLEKPTFAYVHTLRAPKIINGRASKIEKETRRGDTYTDYDYDFIGRPLCTGDYGILADKGVDPVNCPICKRSTQTDEVGAPERRFAMNVIRYAMTRDGKLVQPFACQNLVWGYTEGVYNRLIDIAQEHGALLGRDLLLGPCTNEPFQKYEIQAGAQSLWQAKDEIKQTVVATYQSNRVSELERACGRKSETRWMMKDLDTISERWRTARGEKDGTEAADSSAALNDGIAALLNDNGKPASAEPAVDMASLLNTGSQTAAQSTPAPSDELSALLAADQPAERREPARTAPSASSSSSGDVHDLSSILDQI